jgi:hypothetical protein
MEKIIKEQIMSSIDLRQARDVYKCPFVLGSEFVKTNYYTDGVMKKVADKDSKTPGNFVVGDTLMIKKDFTFDVIRDNKIVKSNLKWACSILTTDQNDFINRMVEVEKVQKVKPSDYDENIKNYVRIDLHDRDANLFPQPGKYFVWKKSGLETISKEQYAEVDIILNLAGYTRTEPSINDPNYSTGRPIVDVLKTLPAGSKFVSMFKDSPTKVWIIKKEDLTPKETVSNLLQGAKESKINRSECQKTIKFLYKNATKNISPEGKYKPSDLLALKTFGYKCATQGMDFLKGVAGIQDEIDYLKRNTGPYGFQNLYTKRESKEKVTNMIKENLIEISKNKKKILTEERKIVKTRFSLITENVDVKSEKGKEKFFNDLLTEMVYLNKQGFNQEVISEGFFDLISGIFGKSGDSIMGMFKEYITGWLIEKFTPLDTKGWMATAIRVTVGNLSISDIPKLLDCNYTSKFLTKNIVETLVAKFAQDAKMDSGFYNFLRQAMVEVFDSSEFGQKVESSVANFICPLLGGVKEKMSDVSDQMKQKVMS